MHVQMCLASGFTRSNDQCSGATIISDIATCQAAAAATGIPFQSQAGTEWASGCLIHGQQVYYSPDEDGSTQNPTDAYLCKAGQRSNAALNRPHTLHTRAPKLQLNGAYALHKFYWGTPRSLLPNNYMFTCACFRIYTLQRPVLGSHNHH